MTDRLKPHVCKIKGAKNYGLYDMLHGKFYQIEPTGTIKDLRRMLKELDLIFETAGFVPKKLYSPSTNEWFNTILVRVLQIRLNGNGENNCWDRKAIGKIKPDMNEETLERVKEEFEHIPIKKIKVVAMADNKNLIENILKQFNYFEIEIIAGEKFVEQNLEYYKSICDKKKRLFTASRKPEEIVQLRLDIDSYFYSENFNPCWGHQIAIDTKGEIKPCLWSNIIIGNLKENNIKNLITIGKFDDYWSIRKDNLQICKECEYRYVCNDCRVSSVNEGNGLYGKPTFCKYNPLIGEDENG